MNRGQALLVAQRPGMPLGAPPSHLTADELRAWHDIVEAAPNVLRESDHLFVSFASGCLADWRESGGDLRSMRQLYRLLGDAFIPMRDRRRLLFPDRCRRR